MGALSLEHYLVVSSLLFGLGLFGVITRRHAVALLLSVELIMLAVALNFTAAACFLGHAAGQVFAIFVITVAAAEAAVGLAVVIAIYRTQQDADLDRLTVLKG
ncbi:MAG: NADH-quinone oxidoreductase subunit NuoK [candidate division FCPU426 bacterium]